MKKVRTGNDIEVFRGDTFTRTLTFLDNSQDPIDITGWTVYFTIKKDKDDPDASAVIKKDITSHSVPLSGQTILSLTASELDDLLGDYYYDFQIKKDDGTIKTLVVGKFIVYFDVTRRTT